MRHFQALEYRTREPDLSPPRPEDRLNCQGELLPDGGGFWGDVRWVIGRCDRCGDRLAMVGGMIHWWNYTLKPQEDD